MAAKFADWLQKNFRDQPWSSSTLVPRLQEWTPEIKQSFAEGRLEATVRARVLLAFFALSPEALASLTQPLHALLDWVDAEERDEWVRLSAGLLRSVVGETNCEATERSASATFLAAKGQDVVDALLRAEDSHAQKAGQDTSAHEEGRGWRSATQNGSASYERAILGPALSPSEIAVLSANSHFSVSAKASTLDWSLKRRFSNINDDNNASKDEDSGKVSAVGKRAASVDHRATTEGDQKCARVDVKAEAVATGADEAWTPSDKVLSVLGEHTSLLTREVSSAIEQLLALITGGTESSATKVTAAQPAAKYKVHESVTSDGTAKESVYVLLDFSARTWKKTKKVKKLNKE